MRHVGLIVAVIGSLAVSAAAPAAPFTWNKTAAGTYGWDDQANWGGGAGGFPNAIGDLAGLAIDLAGAQTINLNQAITTGTITLGDTTTGFFGTTIAGNGGSLTMQVASGTASISKATTGNNATDTISANITLGSSLAVANAAASGPLTFSGSVTGSSVTLAKTGAGALNLNGTTTVGNLNVGFAVAGGSVVVGNAGALTVGAGSANNLYVGVTANAGTLDVSAAQSFTANVGNLYVGVNLGAATSVGTLKLGLSNSITAANQIVFGGNVPDSDASASHVATVTTAAGGTTTFLTPSMALGTAKGAGTLTAGTNSTVNIGSSDARTSLVLGRSDTGNGYDRPGTGTMNLSAGVANLRLSSLVLGRKTVNGATTSTAGTLTLSGSALNRLDVSGTSGVLGVVQIGYSSVVNMGARGTLTIGNLGTDSAIVSTDDGTGILIANGALTSGTLTLNSGTLTVTTSGAAIRGGGGTSTLNLANGVTLRAGKESADWIGSLTTAALGSGGARIDTDGNTVWVSQGFSGTGGLTKVGAGTLTLFGASTYSGATTIDAGSLQLGNGGTGGSLAPSSAIAGSVGTTLAINRVDTVTQGTHFAGTLGGPIGLVQLGSGTVELTGANTYTGTTSVNAGTLQIGNGGMTGSLAPASAITGSAGATLAFNRADAVTQGTHFAGVIGGEIGVTQRGGGTLELTGANTYTGTTSVVAGTVSLTGNGSLATTGAVDVAASGATFDISGITAPGLTIASLSGSAGSLLALGGKSLTFGDATSTTFAGGIGGVGGGFTKQGTGKVTLAGVGTFTGPATIAAGILAIDGQIASGVTVQTGAALGGAGVIAGNVGGDGLIAPGNSPGILTVQGQVAPTASTSFAFEFSGTGVPTWSSVTASVNDVLRLTGTSPFAAALVATNTASVYFDVSSLAPSDTFDGGFYSDQPSGSLDFGAAIGTPTFRYFVKGDGGGTHVFNGQSYYTLAEYIQATPTVSGVAWSVVTVPAADFSGGTVTNGQVSRFAVVPEPAALTLVVAGASAAIGLLARRRRVA